MSMQFTIKRLMHLKAKAVVANHDGTPYVNEYIPNGAMLSEDVEGNAFYFTGWMPDPMVIHDPADSFPTYEGRKSVRLFRDYWRYAGFNWNDDRIKLSPACLSLFEADYETIWEA